MMTQKNDTVSSRELARERTDWAYERTYFALLRTGLAIAGGGTLVVSILGKGWSDWVVGLLAGPFIVVGFIIILGALRRYHKLSKRLALEDENIEPISTGLVVALTVILQVAIVAMLILFLLN